MRWLLAEKVFIHLMILQVAGCRFRSISSKYTHTLFSHIRICQTLTQGIKYYKRGSTRPPFRCKQKMTVKEVLQRCYKLYLFGHEREHLKYDNNMVIKDIWGQSTLRENVYIIGPLPSRLMQIGSHDEVGVADIGTMKKKKGHLGRK